ncbi:dienelactone hydrolase [Umbelopsis sp. PMI_123]|nr:dienelactone hydrolase [Umbelopsis sp. PMI_123]
MSSSLNITNESLECCRRGAIRTGTPTGKEIMLAGLKTYFAPAGNGKPVGALLYITDAMGWDVPNARLLADTYAADGNLDVYIPNILDNDAIPAGAFSDPNKPFDLASWAQKIIGLRPQHGSACLDAVKELRSKYKKVAVTGYCFGGYYSILLAHHDDLVDCAVASHPSLVAVPEDIERIKKPVFFVCAEVDQQLTDEKREAAKEILAKKPEAGCFFKLYPGTTHGFTVRPDPDGVSASLAAKDATITWITKHFEAIKA